ncbi:MAG: choice-of-anchor Q domain-containing protein, partial [Nanoarchaeota archaeon]
MNGKRGLYKKNIIIILSVLILVVIVIFLWFASEDLENFIRVLTGKAIDLKFKSIKVLNRGFSSITMEELSSWTSSYGLEIKPVAGEKFIGFKGVYGSNPLPWSTNDFAYYTWENGEDSNYKDYIVNRGDVLSFYTLTPEHYDYKNERDYHGCGIEIDFTDGTNLRKTWYKDQDNYRSNFENLNSLGKWYLRKIDINNMAEKTIKKISLVNEYDKEKDSQFECYFDNIKIINLVVVSPPTQYLPSPTSWSFSWNVRTDRDGKPAGYFDQTPFPITETTTSYSIKNDEDPDGSLKVYQLGTKYYVDGGYTGGSNDGSFTKPYKTISAALSTVSAGNKAIIVRGAHDGFSGIYNEVGLTLKSGINDTYRFMIVGYGQERPIINGVSTGLDTISGGTYATVQRLKIQDNYRNGIRTGQSNSYINVIDVWLYNNDKWDSVNNKFWADGNLYFLGADNNWIYHSTAERSSGHGFKIGDDADNNLVEWSVAKEAGYWAGSPLTSWYGAHPTACDFPADAGMYNDNITVRYNICGTSLFYAVQLRRTPNFSFHHNEVYDGIHFGNVSGARAHGIQTDANVLIYADGTYGELYSNIIRDPGTNEPGNNIYGIGISGASSTANNLNIYNNLIYSQDSNEAGILIKTSDIVKNIFSNSIYTNANTPLIYSSNAQSNQLNFKNNIFHQAGTGKIIDFNGLSDWTSHTYNLYYAPSGSIGTTLGTGEQNANPQWQAIPSGEYSPNGGGLLQTSPAINTGTTINLFSRSFNGITRPQGSAWDIGAYEYGTATPQCSGASDCNDNNVCNGAETCVSGTCQAGTALNCDDFNSCTTDTCNAITGCSNSQITSCINSDTCCPSGCNSGNDNNCTNPPPVSGLVLHLSLNENVANGGTLTDASGNNNYGTLYNALYTSSGINGAYTFDGTDDYINILNSASLSSPSTTNAITITAWVKPDVFDYKGYIVSKNSGA